MKQQSKLAGLAMLLGVAAQPALAQDKIKVGVIVTLSGPAAALGQQVRDGFALGVKDLGGKMSGRDVDVTAVDDELKPDAAVTKVKGLLERDKVDFVVGPIFSNILLAIHKPVIDTKTFLISPNAGPSSYAGKECSPFFYVTSYQNDQVHEILGKVAQDRGYKRVYVLVPNYQAGKDSAAGFKLDYKGEIVEESYMPLGTLDFQVELTKIASAKPDAVFSFMPGGMGVGLVKQYKQAGLADKIPVLSAFTVDESTLPAQQDAATGMFGGANWAPHLDNPQNKKFVAEYEAAYNAVPATYRSESTLPAQQDAATGMFGGANWAPHLDNPQNKKFVAEYEAAYNAVPATYRSESTLPAQQDAATGMFGGANWAPNLDNPQNKKFVAEYEAAYNAVPATYRSESTLPAQQDAATGMFGGANWAPNLDNPQNKKFVAEYEAAYNAVPATY